MTVNQEQCSFSYHGTSYFRRERRRRGRQNGLIGRSSMLNDHDMAAYRFLKIFMTRKA